MVVDTASPAGLTPGEVDAVVRDRAARGLPMPPPPFGRIAHI